MNAEIVTIGDELLLGQVTDTNSSWLGQELNKLGIKVHYKCAVSDTREAILQALKDASNRSNVVILTGGLGPTKDDITKVTLAEFFGSKLVTNERVLNWVQSIFKSRNLPMVESNNLQAMVPDNCEVLWNRNGTAPGMWFFKNGVAFISMPGVPFEMKSIFEEEAIPKLRQTFTFPSIVHRTILTCNIGESFLARKISHIENALPEHIKLAYLPAVAMVRLRFSAYGENKSELEKELADIISELYKVTGEFIYGEEEDTLSSSLGKLLKSKSKTISTAESCTGGYLAHQITLTPGSSSYYMGSIISYANAVKQNELYVPDEILKQHGAVSEPCVIAMAEGVRKKMNTDYSISTSGIAGPDGGTPDKPVGTVWIAVSSNTQTIARVFNMGDNRERTIQRAAIMGMDMLRKLILSENN